MRFMFLSALLVCTPIATAQPTKTDQTDYTRAWLELQKSNNASWGEARPISGEQAQKIHQRYLDSFNHGIPEKFERDQFVGESSGG